MNPPASASPPPAGPPPRRSLWRDSMLWLIGSILVVTVGVNLTMVWFAEEEPPDLVRSDYYTAAKDYDADHAARLASARLGWQVSEVPGLIQRDTLALRIADAAGHPVSGMAGSVSAYRPSSDKLDQSLAWSEDPAQPGLYRATFARPAQGLWRVTLDVKHEGKRLYQDLSVVMP